MRIDPAPFVDWFDRQAAILGMRATLQRIGWNDEAGERRINRWRNENDTVEALDVHEALHAADIDFDDIYVDPGFADARAWLADEGETPSGREWTARRKLGKPIGVHGRMTEQQVRAAHTLHVHQGLSIRALGRLLWERFGYASARSCANSLSDAFRIYGLPARDRIDATVAASTTHGKASRDAKRLYTPEFAAHRRALRLASGEIKGRPLCAGVRLQYPRKGQPCQLRAMVGSDFCRYHDPALRTDVVQQVAQAREVLGADRQEAIAA